MSTETRSFDITPIAQRRADFLHAQRRADLKPIVKKAEVVKLDRTVIRERMAREGRVALDQQQTLDASIRPSPIITGQRRMIPVAQIPRI